MYRVSEHPLRTSHPRDTQHRQPLDRLPQVRNIQVRVDRRRQFQVAVSSRCACASPMPFRDNRLANMCLKLWMSLVWIRRFNLSGPGGRPYRFSCRG